MIHGILLNDFYEGKICVIICSLPLVYLCINNVIINMISYEGIYLTFIYLHSYEGTLHTVLLLGLFIYFIDYKYSPVSTPANRACIQLLSRDTCHTFRRALNGDRH